MIAWLSSALLLSTAAMLLVLALRRPISALLGASAAYLLWLLPLARLLAPPASWFEPVAGPLPMLITIEPAAAAEALSGAGAAWPWAAWLLLAWGGGAVLFAGWQASAFAIFRRRLAETWLPAGVHCGYPVLACRGVDGPLALGLLRPCIVVPADFAGRYTPAEQVLALAHEAFHHRRRDILANHLALAVLALHWFNPVAWIAFRAFRADQELSCDAAVAAALPPDARVTYGRALVKAASRPGLIAACPLNHSHQLKRRLIMLVRHKGGARRIAAGAAVTATLVGTSLLAGTAGYAQEGDTQAKERRQITIIERREPGQAAPVPSERREFRMRRGEDGSVVYRGVDPEMAARIERCRTGDNALLNFDEGGDQRRTRFLLCNDGQVTDRVEALQRARERIAEQSEFDAETRARVLARIDAEIARARNN